MVFVGLLLKSIFIVIMLCAFFIIGIMVYLYMKVKRVARHFNTAQSGQKGADKQSKANAQAHATDRQSRTSGTRNTDNRSAETTYEEIYDSRSESIANRKIISKDEGEYVDFVEED